MIKESIFIISVLMILYAYIGYPACIALFCIFRLPNNRCRKNKKTATMPTVSYIVTAYNEEENIRRKIEEALQFEYEPEKLELIVASDCSNDGTDSIVKSYAKKGVKLVRATERKGKENAQKNAISKTCGEILVFSDAATILKPCSIKKIVGNFVDGSVGCVSSTDIVIDDNENISGENAYVKYEMMLRRLESNLFSLVGLSGSFFAARKSVCETWDIQSPSDFNVLLNAIKLGMRGMHDQKSVAYYKNITNQKNEFSRKVRTVVRGMSVVFKNIELFNPWKYGLFSWQLFSHKVCRWLVPFFMITALITNIMLMFSGPFWSFLILMQLSLYGLGTFYWFSVVVKKKSVAETGTRGIQKKFIKIMEKIGRIMYYFLLVNMAIGSAWYKYALGERYVFWEPTKR